MSQQIEKASTPNELQKALESIRQSNATENRTAECLFTACKKIDQLVSDPDALLLAAECGLFLSWFAADDNESKALCSDEKVAAVITKSLACGDDPFPLEYLCTAICNITGANEEELVAPFLNQKFLNVLMKSVSKNAVTPVEGGAARAWSLSAINNLTRSEEAGALFAQNPACMSFVVDSFANAPADESLVFLRAAQCIFNFSINDDVCPLLLKTDIRDGLVGGLRTFAASSGTEDENASDIIRVLSQIISNLAISDEGEAFLATESIVLALLNALPGKYDDEGETLQWNLSALANLATNNEVGQKMLISPSIRDLLGGPVLSQVLSPETPQEAKKKMLQILNIITSNEVGAALFVQQQADDNGSATFSIKKNLLSFLVLTNDPYNIRELGRILHNLTSLDKGAELFANDATAVQRILDSLKVAIACEEASIAIPFFSVIANITACDGGENLFMSSKEVRDVVLRAAPLAFATPHGMFFVASCFANIISNAEAFKTWGVEALRDVIVLGLKTEQALSVNSLKLFAHVVDSIGGEMFQGEDVIGAIGEATEVLKKKE